MVVVACIATVASFKPTTLDGVVNVVPRQVRIIVWKTRNVVAGDEFTGMSDLYAKLWMDGCEPQKTDTHLR